MATIFDMEKKFKKLIELHSILEYHIGIYVVTGTRKILMGLHMDMYYPEHGCLSKDDIEDLKNLVEKYYAPVVAIVHKPKSITSLGWKSYDDPHHKVHIITFVFETGEQYQKTHPDGI